MEKPKKTNYLKIIIIFFFIFYTTLYILNLTGYYDGSIKRKVEFTNAQIQQFEQDVNEGKNIDLEDYLENQNRSYSSGVSKFGYTINKGVDTFLNQGIGDIISVLSKLFS